MTVPNTDPVCALCLRPIPPGVPHAIRNSGLGDLTFIVVTTPVEDR